MSIPTHEIQNLFYKSQDVLKQLAEATEIYLKLPMSAAETERVRLLHSQLSSTFDMIQYLSRL